MKLLNKLSTTAWAVLAGSLLVLLLIQTVRIDGLPYGLFGVKGLVTELDNMTADRDRIQKDLDALEGAGKQMQGETTRTITRWKERKVYVDREAKRIEDAPLPGQCRTPELVLEAVE